MGAGLRSRFAAHNKPSWACPRRAGTSATRWRCRLRPTFDTLTVATHPNGVRSLVRRVVSVVCLLAFVQGAVAQCAGWQATPEERMQCCQNGECPLHHHQDGASRTHLTQVAVDDCCAQSQGHQSRPPGAVFASAMTLVVLPSLQPVVVRPAPTTLLSAPWGTPSPPTHVPRFLLLSVLLV